MRLADAASVIGTSAGAAVAAAVLQSGSASVEFDAMTRKARRSQELAPAVDLSAVFPQVIAVHDGPGSVQDKAHRFAALSHELSVVTPELRRSAIARRVHHDSWPQAPLTITAVRLDGTLATFDRDSGADLVDVLTASCAVPGLWPVATVGEERYLDGGTFSLTNAHLAAGADRVIVLQPMAELPAYATAERTAVLERAVIVEPSQRARAGFGADPFDPDVRGVATVIGYEDGLAALAAVRDAPVRR